MDTSTIISLISLLVSIGSVILSCSVILKNDGRAKLALNWKEENSKYEEAKVQIGDEKIKVRVPQLRIYVNSGSIQRPYCLYPYPIEGNEEHPYGRFDAVHIRLGDSVNKWWPVKQKKVLFAPNSFQALVPEENGGSTYMMHLILGTDGTYHIIMLVYKNLLSGTATLETFDKVDCLNYKEVNNHTYIEQFRKCIKYLKENQIEVL